MSDLVRVKGLSELERFLDDLPAKLQSNVMRGALRAGAKQILEAAMARVPLGPPSSENASVYGGHYGALRASLRVSTKVKDGKVTASVIAGGKSKKSGASVYYAHFVEYGTRPHTITAANRKALSLGGLFFQSVEHPGARPRPFMRPALDTQAQAAVILTGTYIRDRLSTKHGLDTAHIRIEGDE